MRVSLTSAGVPALVAAVLLSVACASAPSSPPAPPTAASSPAPPAAARTAAPETVTQGGCPGHAEPVAGAAAADERGSLAGWQVPGGARGTSGYRGTTAVGTHGGDADLVAGYFGAGAGDGEADGPLPRGRIPGKKNHPDEFVRPMSGGCKCTTNPDMKGCECIHCGREPGSVCYCDQGRPSCLCGLDMPKCRCIHCAGRAAGRRCPCDHYKKRKELDDERRRGSGS